MPLLEKLDDAVSSARPDELRGRLRISSDSAFGTFLLIPKLKRLTELHPKLKIDLFIRDRVDNLVAEGLAQIRAHETEQVAWKERIFETPSEKRILNHQAKAT